MICPAQAQPAWQWSLAYQQGPILKINPRYPEQLRPARFAQLGVRFPSNGEKAWQERYGFPQISWSLLVGELGNGPVLGQAVSVLPRLHGNLWSKGGFRLQYGLGTSFVWMNRPFDPVRNPTNTAIGSRLSSLSTFELGVGRRLGKEWEAYLGFSGIHVSNANARVPNLGINIPAWKIALRYGLEPSSSPAPRKQEFPPSRYRLGIRLGRGMAGHIAPAGPTYPSFLFSPFVFRDWRQKFRFKLGLDAFYHGPSEAFLLNHGADWLNPRQEALGLVLYGGADWLLGRLAITTQLGPYLIRPQLLDYALYTKLGLQGYWFDQQTHQGPQPYVGMYVHAHSGEADFAEFALGWLF
jgi:hypothetical protein